MLQRTGLVDAVMSQDVDAIMFGSAVTLRDWSKEASKHNKSPTHVNILDLPRIKDISGLDPDGMILVALLSGGDYNESGVPGFGPGLACEAARAGFGKDLLDLIRNHDKAGVGEWRERLQFELESNESGYFKTRHRSIAIPETFPDERILGYYMTPAVSPEDQLPALAKKFQTVWESKIDTKALRDYVADTFEWCYKPGAWKFVRVMAPALLAHSLICGSTGPITSADQITERRRHFISDGIPELRLTVVPSDVVALDLDAEEDSPGYLASLAEEDEEGPVAEANDAMEEGRLPPSPSKSHKNPPWQPHNPEKMWIAEAIVTAGARDYVDEWSRIQKEIEADPKKFATRKCRKQKDPPREKLTGGMRRGAILNYIAPSREPETQVSQAAETSGPIEVSAGSTVMAPSAPRTPTRQTIRRPALDSFPKMQNYFKSIKGGAQVQSAPEMSDPVEKLSQEFEEALSIEGANAILVGENNSRPSTSTSNSSGDPEKMAKKSTKKLRKERGDRLTSTVHNPTIDLAKPGSQTSVRADKAHEGQDPENAILIVSSPVERTATLVDKFSVEGNLSHSEMMENVTTRATRRTKRSAKDLNPPSTSVMGGRPQRARRPIEHFFAPYIAASQQEVSASMKDAITLDLPEVPAEHSMGMPIDISSSHIHAVPRSSLPGTWKEIECGSAISSQTVTTAVVSTSRLSIVDLTES